LWQKKEYPDRMVQEEETVQIRDEVVVLLLAKPGRGKTQRKNKSKERR